MQFRIGEDKFTIYKRPKQDIIVVKIIDLSIEYYRGDGTISKVDPSKTHKYEAEFERLVLKYFMPEKAHRRKRRAI